MYAQMVMMMACVAHIEYKPFVEKELDVYEFISLISSALIFFLGAITQGADSYRGGAQVLSAITFIGFLLYSIGFGGKVVLREKKQEDCPKGLYHSQVGVIVSRLEFKTVTAFRCTTADVPHSENGFQMRIRSVQLPGVLGDSDDFHIVALSY